MSADTKWAKDFVEQEKKLDKMVQVIGNEPSDTYYDLSESLFEQWREMDQETKTLVKKLRR